MRHLVSAVTVLTALFIGASAHAKPKGMKASLAPLKVSLDGLPTEFDGEWRQLDHAVKGGGPDDTDLAAQVLLAYDDAALWVAADVTDDKLVGGGDRVELVLGIPGGKVFKVELFPGVAGKTRASVKSRGRAVRGAKIVEAPTQGGYSLEAKIPWSAIPNSSTVRIGYRGGLFVHDADRSRSVEQIIGTAESRSYGDLPPISTASEIALGSGLLRKRNITKVPKHNLLANVVGDKMMERVLVYDRFLVILGPGYRNGDQYYFRDLGADADDGDLLRFELNDYTGDGRADVLMRRRVRGSKGRVEVFEVLSYHPGDEVPVAVFSQEVLLDIDGGKIENEVQLSGRGSRTRIVLKPGTSDGIDASRFERVSNTGANPVLVPWGDIASQTYTLDGGAFVVSDEQSKEPELVPRPAPSPRQRPTDSDDKVAVHDKQSSPAVDKVYAKYKKQRNVKGKARFDLMADLSEDKKKERLVVHGRDLVVFGEGFLRGRGFAAVELSHFERSKDVTKVSTRDVTGDGRHEILVRGVIRSPLPDDIPGGHMSRSVIIIYKLRSGHFERIFAAEIGRSIGRKRIDARIQFPRGKIELKPGKASGYDEGSYPWLQRKDPDGGFEPLLLPWGGIKRVRLNYNGDKFTR